MTSPAGWNWNNVQDTAWSVPAEDVYYFLHRWQDQGFRSVLDLGCGIGRHALLFADRGFQVTAADVSDTGLGRMKAAARERGLFIAALTANVTHLPFEARSFDAILAYHSIYHVDSKGMERAIGETRRVLRPGGEVYLTVISKTSPSFTDPACPAVDANVRLKKEQDGTVLPHFFANEGDIQSLLADFTILRMRHVQDFFDGRSSWHYFIHAAAS